MMNNKLRVVVWACSLLVAVISIVAIVYASKEEDLSGGFMQAVYEQMVHDARLEQERRNSVLDYDAIALSRKLNAPVAIPAQDDGWLDATIIATVDLRDGTDDQKDKCMVSFHTPKELYYAFGCKWEPLLQRVKPGDRVRIKPGERVHAIIERVERIER